MPAGTGFVRHPGEGEVFNRITFKAGGADTDGRLAVAEDVMEEEGQGAFLVHAHSNCDEAWWVLEGEVIFLIGDEQVTAPMGAFVYVPRGVFHCYWNPRSTRARVMMQWM